MLFRAPSHCTVTLAQHRISIVAPASSGSPRQLISRSNDRVPYHLQRARGGEHQVGRHPAQAGQQAAQGGCASRRIQGMSARRGAGGGGGGSRAAGLQPWHLKPICPGQHLHASASGQATAAGLAATNPPPTHPPPTHPQPARRPHRPTLSAPPLPPPPCRSLCGSRMPTLRRRRRLPRARGTLPGWRARGQMNWKSWKMSALTTGLWRSTGGGWAVCLLGLSVC